MWDSLKEFLKTSSARGLLVSEGKLSVMHSLRLSGEILCQIFLVHPKCTLGGSTKFHTFQGGGGGPYFLMLSPNLSSKIFPFTKRSGLRIFSEGEGGGPYFLMLSPNLWSKIFPFTKHSGLRIFSEGRVRTFWCWVQICGQKFFPLPSALDLEFFQGGRGPYFLMLSPNLWSKIFSFTKRSGLRIFSC